MADAFADAVAARSGPTPKELQQAILLDALGNSLKASEAELKSLGKLVTAKNEQVLRLEAENLRLKMTRTDKELATQIDGLRIEVGKKDRERVELLKNIATFKENEVLILRRAAVAEQKILVLQNTIATMQKGRDAAYAETEKHDRERLDAVRLMIDAQDRAKRAETRVAELEKKPSAKDQGQTKIRK